MSRCKQGINELGTAWCLTHDKNLEHQTTPSIKPCPFCDYDWNDWSLPWHTSTGCGFNGASNSMKKIYNLELSLSEAKGRILDLEKVGNDLVKHLEMVLGDMKLSGTYHLKERLKKILETAKPGEGK